MWNTSRQPFHCGAHLWQVSAVRVVFLPATKLREGSTWIYDHLFRWSQLMYVRSATEFLLTQIWFTAELFLFEMETDFFRGIGRSWRKHSAGAMKRKRRSSTKLRKMTSYFWGTFCPFHRLLLIHSWAVCYIPANHHPAPNSFTNKTLCKNKISLEIYKSNTWRRNEFGFSNKSVDYLSY